MCLDAINRDWFAIRCPYSVLTIWSTFVDLLVNINTLKGASKAQKNAKMMIFRAKKVTFQGFPMNVETYRCG